MSYKYDPVLDILAPGFDFLAYERRLREAADCRAAKVAAKAGNEPAAAPACPPPAIAPPQPPQPERPAAAAAAGTSQARPPSATPPKRPQKPMPLQPDEEVMLVVKERIEGFLNSIYSSKSEAAIRGRRQVVQAINMNLSKFLYIANILDGQLGQALTERRFYDRRPEPEVERDHNLYAKSLRERFGYAKIL